MFAAGDPRGNPVLLSLARPTGAQEQVRAAKGGGAASGQAAGWSVASAKPAEARPARVCLSPTGGTGPPARMRAAHRPAALHAPSPPPAHGRTRAQVFPPSGSPDRADGQFWTWTPDVDNDRPEYGFLANSYIEYTPPNTLLEGPVTFTYSLLDQGTVRGGMGGQRRSAGQRRAGARAARVARGGLRWAGGCHAGA